MMLKRSSNGAGKAADKIRAFVYIALSLIVRV